MEALKVEGLAKYFGALRVLEHISFSLEAGEHVAVIGPNGAGKTTLFNVINGDLPLSGGRVYFWGQEVTHVPTHRRIQLGLARSFQTSILFPTLSVLVNIVLAVQGKTSARYHFFRPTSVHHELIARARRLLERMDLWDKREDLVQSLSHGELRRMDIALALASEPRLILLDEPSAGLTMAETEALIRMIKDLAKETTVLFVAHDMDMVFGLADRIMVLYYGHIIAQGSPKEIEADRSVRQIYLGIDEDTTHAAVS